MRRMLAVTAVGVRRRLRSKETLALGVVAVVLGSLAAGDGASVLYPVVGGAYTPVTTAAMVGLEAGLIAAYATVLAGYFVLRGSVAHDRTTGVNQLTATTPVSRIELLTGTWLAYVTTVTSWLFVVGVAAVATHAGFDVGVGDVAAVFGGVLLLGVPTGAFVAGVTVVFESVDRLGGTTGSVIYFFGILAYVALTLDTYSGPSAVPFLVGVRDLFGNITVYQLTVESVRAVEPGYSAGSPGFYTTFLGGVPDETAGTFRYEGGWPPLRVLFQRGVLAGFGVVLAVVAAVPYDRWDPTTDERTRLWSRLRGIVSGDAPDSPADTSVGEVVSTSVDRRDADRLSRLVALELRRLLRGRRWWWYVGVAVLLALTPMATTLPRQQYVGAALVWPVFVWSSIGVESSHGPIRPIVHSSDRSFRQLTAEWLAGVLVAGFVTVPPILAAGVSPSVVVAAVTVAVFVPATALAVGVWVGSSRAFELGYLVLWYLGPMNVETLDYGGATLTAVRTGTPRVFLAVTPVVLFGAYLGRRRRLGT